MTPYYEDETVVIYHADCREFLWPNQLDAQCVVTSPPYNSGVRYDGYDDRLEPSTYAALADDASMMLATAIAYDGGRAWVNVGVDCWRVWSNALDRAGLQFQTTVCWDYGVPTRDCAWGSWCSPAVPHLRYGWEPVVCAWGALGWKRTPPARLESWRDELGGWEQLCRNLWRIAPGASARARHPAVMPLELAVRAVRLSTWPGEVVLDPFMGSGTTLAAARLLGRRAIGVEVSERYCELAVKRLGQQVLDLEARPAQGREGRP